MSFSIIHKFFRDSEQTLVNMKPNDVLLGNKPGKYKCMSDNTTFILYLANPNNSKPGEANVSRETVNVTFQLPEGSFAVRWFNPRSGQWTNGSLVSGQKQSLISPGRGDWVLLLEKRK